MQTVVILHGWGQDHTFWQGAFAGATDIEVLVLDMPGFGREPLVSADWGIPEYAAWTQNKIVSAGLGDVVLLGHSFGGRVAAAIASEHPAWLKALILYAAPCLYRPTTEVAFKKKVAKLARAFGLGGRYHGNPELVEAEKNGLGAIYRRVVNFDQTDTLKKITVPTLLVWGAEDNDVPLRIAEEMHQLIAGSTLEVLPKVGHNAHLENPPLFYGVAKRFIAKARGERR